MLPAAVLKKANANAHELTRMLTMTDAEFKLHAQKKWWEVLDVSEGELPGTARKSNVIKQLGTLRNTFNAPGNAYLTSSGPDWIGALLTGKVLCSLCHRRNKSHGIVQLSVDKVVRHMDGKKPHGKALAALGRIRSQQPKIYDAGAGGAQHTAAILAAENEDRRHLALVAGSLVAGGDGAAGLKVSSIPALFDLRMLRMLASLRGGMPVASTLRTSVLPDAMALLKARFVEELRNTPVSIACDGGGCHKAAAAKVLCFVASSLVPLPSGAQRPDRLLRVEVQRSHETGKSLAASIASVCNEYQIRKEDLFYIVADNASVNPAAVKELQATGFNVRYARCLPHSLALVIKAFLDVFDKELKLSTNLKEFRGFLTAGGGRGRRGLALEHGIKCCKIDFCETRWASFLKALLALANLQTPDDLKAARKELQAIFDEAPTDELKEVLAEEDVPRMLFNVIYEFLEAISESDLAARKNVGDEINGAEADLPKLRKKLLKFFSSISVFAGLQVIDIVMGGNKAEGVPSTPTLMTLTQGAPGYAAKLKISATGNVPDATQASRSMIRVMKGLLWEARWGGYKWPPVLEDAEGDDDSERGAKQLVIEKLERVEKELRGRLRVQADAVIANARASDEPLVLGNDTFDEDQVPIFLTSTVAMWEKVVPRTMELLQTACAAVDGAAGLKKLEECVAALEASSVFSLNERPRSFEREPGLAKHLGCEGASLSAFAAIEEGWGHYEDSWRKPKPAASPLEVRFFFHPRMPRAPQRLPSTQRRTQLLLVSTPPPPLPPPSLLLSADLLLLVGPAQPRSDGHFGEACRPRAHAPAERRCLRARLLVPDSDGLHQQPQH
jgi:hypothetical protein